MDMALFLIARLLGVEAAAPAINIRWPSPATTRARCPCTSMPGWRFCRSSQNAQCVVAWCPSSRPVSASSIAPEHAVAMVAPAACQRRNHSISGSRSWARTVPGATASSGITTTPGLGQSSKRPFGVISTPLAMVTGRPSRDRIRGRSGPTPWAPSISTSQSRPAPASRSCIPYRVEAPACGQTTIAISMGLASIGLAPICMTSDRGWRISRDSCGNGFRCGRRTTVPCTTPLEFPPCLLPCSCCLIPFP